MLNPQLPANTDVTPCSGVGLRSGSQNACASRWVCTSMKPGVTMRPSALITLVAPSSAAPIDAIRPSTMPMSAARRLAPVPSMTKPFLINRSSIRAPFGLDRDLVRSLGDAESVEGVALDCVAPREQIGLVVVELGALDETLQHRA